MSGRKIFQIVGFKNSGKTTLIESLLRLYAARGLRLGTIKRDAHDFEADLPGTDSRRHRDAGSVWTAITSPRRTAIFSEAPSGLDELASLAPPCELLLVEGFKRERYPKLALLRRQEDAAELSRLPAVTAFALWPEAAARRDSLGLPTDVPVFNLDDVGRIAEHILKAAGAV